MSVFDRLDREMELLKAEVKAYRDTYDYIMGAIDPDSVTGCCSDCKAPATKWSSYEHPGGWRVRGLKGKQWMYFDCPNCNHQTSWDCLKIPR